MSNSADILIVEDSATQAGQLEFILQSHGFNVRVAVDGARALDMIADAIPTLVISDVIMPNMNGYELCRHLREVEETRLTPFILLTTLSDAQDVIKGLACGADCFIRKPYEEKYLLSRINYCLTNLELRQYERVQSGLELNLNGKRFYISAARQQILDLLISTYEQAVGLNAELLCTNRDMENFTVSVSHDLRSPLGAVRSFAEFLRDEYRTKLDKRGQLCVDSIVEGCDRMLELITGLLNFSRHGRQAMSFNEVDMQDLITEVIAELQASGQNTRCIDISELPNAWGDSDLLKHVWTNLLANALKYSSKQEQPLIQVVGQRSGAELIYQVRDNGVGFDMKYYERLFGVFQRLHAESDFPGTGVGLALVHKIISRHGGRVWAESAPSKGASFYFSLPVYDKPGVN